MQLPNKKFIFENIFKVIIFNVALSIAFKFKKQHFYLVYALLLIGLVFIFSFIDDSISDDDVVNLKKSKNFDKYIRKKKSNLTGIEKIINYFFLSPSRKLVLFYYCFFSVIFFIFNEDLARFGETLIGSFLLMMGFSK